ncbi:MAG TPA: ABC-type transport auxiliary lipoprotein family protein [Burkholderiaceae bacterium]|jgi:cholesterol transport system auxiliary component|nr:ABC-type transport auxiliary lipoprotein family protein [Burkholderiaceae bacterium]
MTGAAPGTIVRAIVVAFGASVLAGCALLTPVKIDTRKEMLTSLPLDLPQRANCARALLVFPPQARPIYDTTQMAYAIQGQQVAYFSQHEWGETPSQMLLPLLVSALRRTHCFNAVVTPPYPYAYSYALRTDIVALLQDFTTQPATLQLSLRVQLSDDVNRRVIASKELTLREPMPLRTPEDGVAAANAATAEALRQVVMFVFAATSSSRSRP